MNPAQHADNLHIVEIDVDSPELGELRHFPQHDGRNAPAVRSEELRLALAQCARHRIEEEMGIKIEHSNGSRSRGRRP